MIEHLVIEGKALVYPQLKRKGKEKERGEREGRQETLTFTTFGGFITLFYWGDFSRPPTFKK